MTRSRWRRRAHHLWSRRLLISVAASVLVWAIPSETQTAEPLKPPPAVTLPIQDFSRRALMPNRAPSQRAALGRNVRTRLIELAASLDALARDPSSDRVADLLTRRKAAGLAVASLRGARSRRHGGLPGEIESRLDQLWEQVYAAAADPIGQRARLDIARRQIMAALAQPRAESGISSVLSVPNPVESEH